MSNSLERKLMTSFHLGRFQAVCFLHRLFFHGLCTAASGLTSDDHEGEYIGIIAFAHLLPIRKNFNTLEEAERFLVVTAVNLSRDFNALCRKYGAPSQRIVPYSPQRSGLITDEKERIGIVGQITRNSATSEGLPWIHCAGNRDKWFTQMQQVIAIVQQLDAPCIWPARLIIFKDNPLPVVMEKTNRSLEALLDCRAMAMESIKQRMPDDNISLLLIFIKAIKADPALADGLF